MGSSQQFSLRWNNYLRHITSAFDSLRSDLDLVDVTLSCEGKKIKAHKMLLSACSTYFKDLFKENPCQHPVIIFRNVNFSDLEALVDFMYQGEVNVVQEQLASFLTTAELLAVQGLTDGNGQELAEGLDMQGESSEALGGAERSTEKKLPNNDSSSSFYSSNQNPMSPPAKRKKWNTSSSPSSSQRASSDLTERRRTAQISSDGVTNPVDIIPVMSQVKVEIPEFLDSGQISFNNTGQEGNPLSDLSVLDHNMPNTSRGGKEESGDVYGGSANDAGDIAGEQMTPAELSEVLSKAGPSSDGSQDSLQGGEQQSMDGQWTRPQCDESVKFGFTCEICGKSFKHRNSRYNHMPTHFGITKCPICHIVLGQRSNVKRHLRHVHRISIAPS